MIEILGRDYIVWDKSASIRFRKPGRGTVYAKFRVTDEQIAEIRELLKNSLRMRPDRIIVGEVRGGEAFDMLQAMNTGHDGSMSTIHASDSEQVPLKLTAYAGLSPQPVAADTIGRLISVG